MQGDILVIEPHHEAAAADLATRLAVHLAEVTRPLAIGIAGESGSGKSELAQALMARLAQQLVPCVILQQDDYFHLPPRSNDAKRRRDSDWVGPEEVDLEHLDRDVQSLLNGEQKIQKPLVIYSEDRIAHETLAAHACRAIIVEGTYVSLVPSLDVRVFVDRDYTQTLEARRKRNREPFDPFIERVLEIEHKIISQHRQTADLLIETDYSVREVSHKS